MTSAKQVHCHISAHDAISCCECNPLRLSIRAWKVLSEQCDMAEVVRSWQREDWGTLYASDTAEEIGPATAEQARASYEAVYEGHIETYLTEANGRERGLVRAFVRP